MDSLKCYNLDKNEDKEKVNSIIGELSEHIKNEKRKNKLTLIITGSGISFESVPNMNKIMEKICRLLDVYNEDDFSTSFWELKTNYEKYKSDENNIHTYQSRLLSYIQFAYLKDQNNTVEPKDIDILRNIWNKFIQWLYQGDENDLGLIDAKVTDTHKEIVRMYNNTNTISITTNFDDLLAKAFSESKEKNIGFVPIFTDWDFNNFYLNNTIECNSENFKQMVEIQSRGDVFWSKCSGTKRTNCQNTRTRCYIPEKNVTFNDNKDILCPICGSPMDVYFAFPATKEKDTEMAKVFSMVWKYLALRCSTIIIVGNSMNYDPVLMNFVLELSKREETAILYASASDKPKEITERLFYENFKNRWWICGKKAAEEILKNVNDKLECEIENENSNYQNNKDFHYNSHDYINYAIMGIGRGSVEKYIEADKRKDLETFEELNSLKQFSQLGLKTYWLSGLNDSVSKHNRYKHSVNTMLIASAIYLSVKKNYSNINELRFLQTAALCHDLGHLPFSHLIEEIFQEFGWIPYGEKKTFNHEYNTKNKIEKIFGKKYENDEDKPLIRKFFDETGYSATDLIRLIQGEFGVGYLDAIINSPIDADKIEYLFTDSEFIGQKNGFSFENFMEDFTSNLECNDNQFMVISNQSTDRMVDLIKIRSEMYNRIYLRKGLRYLESCCKLIIKTFITHLLCTDQFIEYSKNIDSQNLSSVKINYVISWIENKLNSRNGIEKNNICEIYLIEEMTKELRSNKLLSNDIKKAIEFCSNKIINTNSEKSLNNIENSYIKHIDVPVEKNNSAKINELIKTVNLRFPGIILLDYVQSKAAFSFSNSGIPKRRSDKTNQRCECIVIKDIKKDYNSEINNSPCCFGDATSLITDKLKLTTNAVINIYKICDEAYKYYIAKDYVLNELREFGFDVAGSIK